MVTAVSQFIEQVGSMIKGMPKPNYHLLTKLHRHLSASQPTGISVHSSSELSTDIVKS